MRSLSLDPSVVASVRSEKWDFSAKFELDSIHLKDDQDSVRVQIARTHLMSELFHTCLSFNVITSVLLVTFLPV